LFVRGDDAFADSDLQTDRVIFPPEHQLANMNAIKLCDCSGEPYVERPSCEMREMVMAVLRRRRRILSAGNRQLSIRALRTMRSMSPPPGDSRVEPTADGTIQYPARANAVGARISRRSSLK
jgi:hypothetical protein